MDAATLHQVVPGRAPGEKTGLSGADLFDASLVGADLRGADLSGALVS